MIIEEAKRIRSLIMKSIPCKCSGCLKHWADGLTETFPDFEGKWAVQHSDFEDDGVTPGERRYRIGVTGK